MSFNLFIYYCALGGGWAALLAGMLVELLNLQSISSSPWFRTISISVVIGVLLAAAIGTLDALLNSVGSERWKRVAVCVGVGLVGSFLGGVLGQMLTNLNLPRFLGWTIVGTMIGASVGVFDLAQAIVSGQQKKPAFRKMLNGVMGGAVGGAVGGVFFAVLQAFAASQSHINLSRSSLAIGLVTLGASIGLLIGLAQIILKEAWVKVEAGFRAGREMMLSKAETTIGRAEGSDIGLFGDSSVERTHARIVLQGHHYILSDAGSVGGTFVNDQKITEPTMLRSGDAIRVGNCVLRFGEKQKRPGAQKSLAGAH